MTSLTKWLHGFMLRIAEICVCNKLHISKSTLKPLQKRSWVGIVVKALASHQRGLSITPGPAVFGGLSLLLVIALLPGIFLQISSFPPTTNTSKFQLIWGQWTNSLSVRNATAKSSKLILFIHYLVNTLTIKLLGH